MGRRPHVGATKRNLPHPGQRPARPLGRLARWMLAMASCVAIALACATNPVTGKRELVLISEAQEIAMGRQADQEVVESIGLYPDQRLQQYVQSLGAPLAARTERPRLPWTFRVVDDAAVNAFAIPGGFVYVTRGILAHLNSEAELVAVLAHEVGHVTARHSVSQMSQQQLAQLGLVAGMVLSPRVAKLGNLAQMGLGMLFLKFSRSDESEADGLGFRYMVSSGYNPREMVDVFRMLQGVGQQGTSPGRLPQWLSSHPDPENRESWATRMVASLNRDVSNLTVNREGYLRRLDGLVFGENPREGFFRGTAFHHPELAFRLEFPAGWTTSNQKQAVGAVSPEQDAVVVVQLAKGSSAGQAAQEFFSAQGIQAGSAWRREIGGFPAVSHVFQAQSEQEALGGLAAWIEYGGRVFQLLGYTTAARWPTYERAFTQALGSFAREMDRSVLEVQPRRLSLVQLARPATLDSLLREYPSSVPPATVSLINNLQGQSTLPAGTYKRVVGGPGR